MSSITFSDISVISKLERTYSKTILGWGVNNRFCGMLVGGDICGRYLLSELIVKVFME